MQRYYLQQSQAKLQAHFISPFTLLYTSHILDSARRIKFLYRVYVHERILMNQAVVSVYFRIIIM